ncbi:MFS transporter [Nonomuraea sediminis]|uniref:MFS transporter n=1 Tax=Nonomuraea sediminis TaxID=2835864 RepID=UPI001BDD0161|nr:MFS transporter [Nonomuraea sediminis]
MGLRDKRVIGWLSGEFLSNLGDQFYIVAVTYIATMAAGARGAALVLTVGTLPKIVLMLFGGAFVDRLGPRLLMVGSDAVRTALAAGLAVYAQFNAPSVVVLASFSLVFGLVDSVFQPATNTLPVHLVAEGQLTRLQGIRTSLTRVALIAGAPAAGFAVGYGGAALAFGVDAASFAVSAVTLATLRVHITPQPRGTGVLRDTWDGLSYVARQPLIRVTLVLFAVLEFALSGPVNVGFPVMARAHAWGASGQGVLMSALGVGTLAGTLAVTLLNRRLGRVGGPALTGCLVVAACYVGLGFGTQLVGTALLVVVAGSVAGALGSIFIPVLQASAEREYLGRVMSLMSIALQGLVAFSFAVTGVLIDGLGLAPTMTLAGGLVALTGVVALGSRELRRARVPGGAAEPAATGVPEATEGPGAPRDR